MTSSFIIRHFSTVTVLRILSAFSIIFHVHCVFIISFIYTFWVIALVLDRDWNYLSRVSIKVKKIVIFCTKYYGCNSFPTCYIGIFENDRYIIIQCYVIVLIIVFLIALLTLSKKAIEFDRQSWKQVLLIVFKILSCLF